MIRAIVVLRCECYQTDSRNVGEMRTVEEDEP